MYLLQWNLCLSWERERRRTEYENNDDNDDNEKNNIRLFDCCVSIMSLGGNSSKWIFTSYFIQFDWVHSMKLCDVISNFKYQNSNWIIGWFDAFKRTSEELFLFMIQKLSFFSHLVCIVQKLLMPTLQVPLKNLSHHLTSNSFHAQLLPDHFYVIQ